MQFTPLASVTRPTETVWSRSAHILELDGMRGLAIAMVTVYRFAREIPADSWTGGVLRHMIQMGDRGVDLFFVLSGFLITGVLLDSREDPHFYRNFFARRTLRIVPLYFTSLFVFLVLVPWVWPTGNLYEAARDQQIYLWTYLANVRMAAVDQWCFGALDHFWSLAVEEHFYLLWPVFVLVLGLRRVFWFALCAAAVCAAARIGFAVLSDNGVAPDVLSPFRFDGLLVGAAIAAVARGQRGLDPMRRGALVALPLCGGACIGLAIYAGRLLTISHSLWAILWGSLLIVLLSSQTTSLAAVGFRQRYLRTLGRYSYAMYVFQSPLIPLVGGVWALGPIALWFGVRPEHSIAVHLVYAAGMFILTFAVAVLSWHLLEKHFLRLKRFWGGQPDPQPQTGLQASPVG